MMRGRPMNAGGTSEDFPFAAMQQQQPPYAGFEHGMMAAGGFEGMQQHHSYDNVDFAAVAFQYQPEPYPHHQILAMPPSGGLTIPPPPPMPMQMQLQMPMPGIMHHGGDAYPALEMVKREGGGGPDSAGRIGMNLGRRTYFSPGDMMAVDGLLMRSRLGGVFGLGFGGIHHQPSGCQAEGCKADLSGAKHYHRRHKVCEYHAKASVVATGGKQQRFCQQCSRFHVLMEFDEAKRSCRKRLAEHNRRRRKPAAAASTVQQQVDKDLTPPSKKLTGTSFFYTADHKALSAAKSTISSSRSNTSAISCQQQLDQISKEAAVARPTALTLGAPPEEEELNTMLQPQANHDDHHHQEQHHFITSLLHNNSSNQNNILLCSSVCSSGLQSMANGEVYDHKNNHHNNNNNLPRLQSDQNQFLKVHLDPLGGLGFCMTDDK